MNPAYLPKDEEGRRWRQAEECGEVIQALAKIGRFGMDSHDPRTGISNRTALIEEMIDLRHAMDKVFGDLADIIREGNA